MFRCNEDTAGKPVCVSLQVGGHLSAGRIDEGLLAAVMKQVSELMEEREPNDIDSEMAKAEGDHRTAGGDPLGGAVDVALGELQNDLVRLRVGVVGAGSVGALVAESLARMGVIDITLIDYDSVEEKNLDRLLHATEDDARLGTLKVESLKRGLLISSTASDPRIHALDASIVEPSAFAEALDMDVVFCCVDRPWARAVCNFLAYVHLIPVIDGGVTIVPGVNRMIGAEWRAHVVTAGHKCLECIGQYDPAGVSLERTGLLEDTHYIEGMTDDANPLPTGENVFAFAGAAAAAEVLPFVAMVVAPAGVRQVPPQLFHFARGSVDLDRTPCRPNCLYSGPWLGRGDSLVVVVTGTDHDTVAARTRRPAGTYTPAPRLRSLRLRAVVVLDRVAAALRSES
jgi:molybdopterin-synthase adenylyltransferase